MGEVMSKLKVIMPLVEGIMLRLYLRVILLNHALLAANKSGEPILVKKGTRVMEVLKGELLAEHKVLEQEDMQQLHFLQAVLEKMRKNCRIEALRK